MNFQKIQFNVMWDKFYFNRTQKLNCSEVYTMHKSYSKTLKIFSLKGSNDSLNKSQNKIDMNSLKPNKGLLKSKEMSQKLFISFQKTAQLPIYTSYSKMDEVKLVTIGLASANRIRQWAEKTLPNGKVVGEVTNANTLHHKTFKPQKGGLFCERIFGPLKDFECACGGGKKAKQLVLPRASQSLPFMTNTENKNLLSQNKNAKDMKLSGTSAAEQLIQQQEKMTSNMDNNPILGHTTSFGKIQDYKRFFCSKCDVEYTWSVIRRYQLGYIKLNAPVTHVWYVKGNPSYISLLLDMKKKHVEYVSYCAETLTLENSLKASATADDFTIGSELPKDLYALWQKASGLSDVTTEKKELGLSNTNAAPLSLDKSNLVLTNPGSEELKNNLPKNIHQKQNPHNVKGKNWYYLNSLVSDSNLSTLALPLIKQQEDKLISSRNNPRLDKFKYLYNTRTLLLKKENSTHTNQFMKSLNSSTDMQYSTNPKSLGYKKIYITQKDPAFIDTNALVIKYEKLFTKTKFNHTLLKKSSIKKNSVKSNLIEHSLGMSILKNQQLLNKGFCSTKKITNHFPFRLLPLNNQSFNSSISTSKPLNAFSNIYIRSSLFKTKYNSLWGNESKKNMNMINDLNRYCTGLASMKTNLYYDSVNHIQAFYKEFAKLNYVSSDKEVGLRLNSLFKKVIIYLTSSGYPLNKRSQNPTFTVLNKVQNLQNGMPLSSQTTDNSLNNISDILNIGNILDYNTQDKNTLNICENLLTYLIALLNKRSSQLNKFNQLDYIMEQKINRVKTILLRAIQLQKPQSDFLKLKSNSNRFQQNSLELLKFISLSKERPLRSVRNKFKNDFAIKNKMMASPYLNFDSLKSLTLFKNTLKRLISFWNISENSFKAEFVTFHLNTDSSTEKTKYLISIISLVKLVQSIYLQNSLQKQTFNFNLIQNPEFSKWRYQINKLKTQMPFLNNVQTIEDLIHKHLTTQFVNQETLESAFQNTLNRSIMNKNQNNSAQAKFFTYKTFKIVQKNMVNILFLNRILTFIKKYSVVKIGNLCLFKSKVESQKLKNDQVIKKQNVVYSKYAKKINPSIVRQQILNSEQVNLNNRKAKEFFSNSILAEFVTYKTNWNFMYKIDKPYLLKLKKYNLFTQPKLTYKNDLAGISNKCFDKPTRKKNLNLKSKNKHSSYGTSVSEGNTYANKSIVNNIYCLSHRELWDQEKDWYFFAYYFFTAPDLEDISVPVYEYRNYDFSLLNTLFSQEPSNTKIDTHSSTQIMNSFSNTSSNFITNPSKGLFPSENKKNRTQSYNSVLKNPQSKNKPIIAEKPNLHISYSGAGMLKTMLSEFDYFELKKIDKQNRILLYDLNKYLNKLKKKLAIYSIGGGKIYTLIKKEFKEICKQRDSLIRRTKFIRKVFRNYTGYSRAIATHLYPNSTAVSDKTDLNSNKSTLDVGMNKLTSMVLTLLPVLPPDLRPIVKMGSQIAASDLNRLYQRVIYRNDRLKKFLKDPTTNGSFEMKYAQRLLQEAVDNLIQNGKSGVVPEKDARGRALKSLSDLLKGKQGRFRQYLLGKRVDYSGRSVIVVGPKLQLHECGLPKEMALELYLPFLIKRILTQNLARTVIGAKALIINNKPLVWSLLREIMKTCPVLLNRAPTLHRLGFQAFQPKLVDGRAILLHPLVCPAFNADFDGDQMAVHVPITVEARTEAWKLMLSRNNLLSPATGEPLVLPSQDMVLGCYYLTNNGNTRTQKYEKGYGMYFDNFNEVLRAYYQGVVSTHAMVWVKWDGFFENPNADHLEQPIEIRINKYGSTYMIYPKHHSILNKQNQSIKRMIRTTPGKILFNSLIQNSLS